MSECTVGYPDVLTCNENHKEFTHARSMREIQKALREGRSVVDPDGDPVSSAKVRNNEDPQAATAIGSFKVGRYGNIAYRVAQILVEPPKFDEEQEMAKLLKSLATSFKRSS